MADEHRLVGPARNADPVDERERRQQQEEEDEDNDEDTSSKSEHPPSLQGASVRKCRPLCENSAILGMEAIEPPHADVDLLDWEADSMAPMQLKVWSRASADRDTKTLVDDQPEGLQREVKGVAAEPTAKRVGGTHLSGKADGSPRPAERQQLLPDREPSPATSFLLTGFSRHTSSPLSSSSTTPLTAAETGRTHKDPTQTRPQPGKATHAQALALQGSEPSSSDDDGGLSDSDPDLSSDDDGCSSKDDQGLSTRVNIPWDPVDELAWRKEGKPWKWIFRKFRGRTEQAVRQRFSIVKRRGE